jgi:uncharacterized protein (DUF1015 family)
MPLLRSFAGLRPHPDYAAEVAAPPYDVLNSAEARALATGKPWSFLHISKPEIDLAPGIDPYSAEVYARGAENFRTMRDQAILQQDNAPCFYLYRLTMGAHTQTGVAAAASVAAYDSGRIRRHELTRPDKEDDRVRQIAALNAQTGPALLTYKRSKAIDELVAAHTRTNKPEYDFSAHDGIRHALWVMNDAAAIEQLTAAFENIERLYIADGHHRSAAASRIAAERRKSNPRHMGEENYNYFLAVAFPDKEMQILPYHRVIKDLHGLTRAAFLERLQASCSVTPVNAAVQPAKPGEFGLYLETQWYRLNLRPELIPQQDPVARLDVSLLHAHVIEPLLGIRDARRDQRIDFVGGIRGLKELERRVDGGEMTLAFSLPPTRMEQLMSVADANELMPPKSTWFEPKLADGLVSHLL